LAPVPHVRCLCSLIIVQSFVILASHNIGCLFFDKAYTHSSSISMGKASHSTSMQFRVKVQFCLDSNQVETFQVPKDVLYEDLWFTAEEYEAIKTQSRTEARAWRKMGYSMLLKETFDMPRHDVEDFINAFCSMEGHLNQRGLERHCSRKHGEERTDCKDRARQSVFDAQTRLSKEGLKADELADSISASYINACREAKIFARRIGKADELVALEKVSDNKKSTATETILGACRNPKMQRRMSNYSTQSMVSVDSTRKPNRVSSRRTTANATSPKSRCPRSPASAPEELYAALA
jgi:hypothetical protein